MAQTPTQKEAYEKLRANRLPYVGAVVLYVDPGMGDIYPGIVVRVHNEVAGRVTLTTFPPGIVPFPVRELVTRDPSKGRGTWHWMPDRED